MFALKLDIAVKFPNILHSNKKGTKSGSLARNHRGTTFGAV